MLRGELWPNQLPNVPKPGTVGTNFKNQNQPINKRRKIPFIHSFIALIASAVIRAETALWIARSALNMSFWARSLFNFAIFRACLAALEASRSLNSSRSEPPRRSWPGWRYGGLEWLCQSGKRLFGFFPFPLFLFPGFRKVDGGAQGLGDMSGLMVLELELEVFRWSRSWWFQSDASPSKEKWPGPVGEYILDSSGETSEDSARSSPKTCVFTLLPIQQKTEKVSTEWNESHYIPW